MSYKIHHFPRRRYAARPEKSAGRSWLRCLASLASLAIALAVWQAARAAEPGSDGQMQPGGQAEISQWISSLDDDRYVVRERATARLLAAGEAAFDALLQTANGDRPEAAERAVDLLRRAGQSFDRQTALAALDRLLQLNNRDRDREWAKESRIRLTDAMCSEAIIALGGRFATETNVAFPDPAGVAVQGEFAVITLDEAWQGTQADLHPLSLLSDRPYLWLVGDPIGDEALGHLCDLRELRYLELHKTRVTPDGVDKLKTQLPNLTIKVKNRALLGIGGSFNGQGVFITTVQADSGAANAGLQINDVIVGFDGSQVKHFDGLTAHIGAHLPGDEIELKILRNGEELTRRVTLGSWPE